MLRSIFLCLLVVGCAASQAPDDGFASRLEAGCETVSQCEILARDAERRYQECLHPPGSPCDATRADHVRAQDLLVRQRSIGRSAAASKREAQEEQARQAALKEEEERTERASLELAAWHARQEARQAEEERLKQAAEEARQQERLAPYRDLTPSARQSLLTQCIQLGHEPGKASRTCGELILDLVAVSTGEQETSRLLALAEAALAKETTRASSPSKAISSAPRSESTQSEPSEGSGRLICCDGTLSPSCECSRASRRGCCSHHKGVCGCDE